LLNVGRQVGLFAFDATRFSRIIMAFVAFFAFYFIRRPQITCTMDFFVKILLENSIFDEILLPNLASTRKVWMEKERLTLLSWNCA